jgi:hypothetical protein
MVEQTMTIDDAMQLAVNALMQGNRCQAADVARQILAVRPDHRGATHLQWDRRP